MAEQRTCKAKSRSGNPCRKAPIQGGAVCATHGGSAPQVKAKAAERIAMMVDPALDELNRIMTSGESDAVRLAAVKDVLDRAGHKPKDKLEHSGEVTLFKAYTGFDPEKV